MIPALILLFCLFNPSIPHLCETCLSWPPEALRPSLLSQSLELLCLLKHTVCIPIIQPVFTPAPCQIIACIVLASYLFLYPHLPVYFIIIISIIFLKSWVIYKLWYAQCTWSKSCLPVVLGRMANSSSASMVVTRTFICQRKHAHWDTGGKDPCCSFICVTGEASVRATTKWKRGSNNSVITVC